MLDNNLSGDSLTVDECDYTLTKLLGSGAHGQVFLATVKGSQISVCIKKQLFNPRAENEGVITKEILGAEVRDYCATARVGKYHYMVMPFFAGDNLESIRTRLTVYEKLLIAEKIKTALDNLHRAGYLHQDHNVDNVMVDLCAEEIAVNLIDFGWATKDQSSNSAKDNHKLNVSFLRMLFQPQTAPEYLYSKKIGRHSDVYSFGRLFEKLFPNRTPFVRKLTDNGDFQQRINTFNNLSEELNVIFNVHKDELLTECQFFEKKISALPNTDTHEWHNAKTKFTEFTSALKDAKFLTPESIIALQKKYAALENTLLDMPGNLESTALFTHLLHQIRDFLIVFIPTSVLISIPALVAPEVTMKKWLASDNCRFFTRSSTSSPSRSNERTPLLSTPPLSSPCPI